MTTPLLFYSSDVQRILDAYRALFRSADQAVFDYLDLNGARSRPWSVLTTNFQTVTPAQVSRLHADRVALTTNGKTEHVLADELVQLSNRHGIGYSLGLSPWTDDLLLRTFTPASKRVVIVLAHDWYPIVAKGFEYVANSPLLRDSPFSAEKGNAVYAAALPDCLHDNARAVLFMNLYPDFRPPCSNKTGDIGAAQYMAGFQACCRTIANHYVIDAIISWGSPAWECLRKWVAPPVTLGVMQAPTLGAMSLSFPGVSTRYFAFPHPSYPPNSKPHAETYSAVCQQI